MADIKKLKQFAEKYGKKAAAALGISVAVTPEESEASRAENIKKIMKAANVGLEEATKIYKDAAKIVPKGPEEEKIKAVQLVRDLVKNPDDFERLGMGVENMAYGKGEKAIKRNRPLQERKQAPAAQEAIVNATLERAGLATPSRAVQTSKRKYVVQDKVKLLEDDSKQLLLNRNNLSRALRSNNENDIKYYRQKVAEGITKEHGINPEKASEYVNKLNPITAVAGTNNHYSGMGQEYLAKKVSDLKKSGLEEADLHGENWGVDSKGNPVILDTGHFQLRKVDELNSEDIELAKNSFVGPAEEKAKFNKWIENYTEGTNVGRNDEVSKRMAQREQDTMAEIARLRNQKDKLLRAEEKQWFRVDELGQKYDKAKGRGVKGAELDAIQQEKNAAIKEWQKANAENRAFKVNDRFEELHAAKKQADDADLAARGDLPKNEEWEKVKQKWAAQDKKSGNKFSTEEIKKIQSEEQKFRQDKVDKAIKRDLELQANDQAGKTSSLDLNKVREFNKKMEGPTAPTQYLRDKALAEADENAALERLKKMSGSSAAGVAGAATFMGGPESAEAAEPGQFEVPAQNAQFVSGPQSQVGQAAQEAKEEAPQEEGALEMTLNALSWPQRRMLHGYAQMLGVPGDVNNAEASSVQIVEAMAEKLGVPPASLIGNLAKAGAVAGLSVLADPMALVGAGTIAKAAKGTNKVVQNVPYKKVDGKTFYNKIQEVVGNKNKLYKANITPYSPEDYGKFSTFMSPDGKSGYAIKPDGELISVFSLEKGRGESLVDDAVLRKGAQKLDAFDIKGKLPKLYGKYFDETGRMKFADEYAPAEWDYDAFGRPDVVTMQVNPKKVGGSVAPPAQKPVDVFAKEANMAPQQKVVQPLTTGQAYQEKMANLAKEKGQAAIQKLKGTKE